VFEFPNLFKPDSHEEEEFNRIKESMNKDTNRYNAKLLNEGRDGVGTFYGI